MELADFRLGLDGNGGDCVEKRDPDSNAFQRPQKRLRVAGAERNCESSGECIRSLASDSQFAESPAQNGVFDVDVKGEVAVGIGMVAEDKKFLYLDLNFKGDGSDTLVGEATEDEGNSDIDLMQRSYRRVNGVSERKSYSFDLNLVANVSDGTTEDSPKTDSPVEVCIKVSDLEECRRTEFSDRLEETELTGAGAFGKNISHSSAGTFAEIKVEKAELGDYLRNETRYKNTKEDTSIAATEVKDSGSLLEGVSDVCLTETSENGVDFLTPTRGRNNKKRRASKNLPDTPQTGLRRSARRAHVNLVHSTTPILVTEESPIAASERGEDLLGSNCSETDKEHSICLKLALPASSTNLNINGLPIFDLFSVYTCLRSFSNLLFLAPFTLESFVAALKCKSANFLMDCIHFSVLRALRVLLESLSSEGSLPAADCFRDLNWDLLDIVTWPIYLVEYLLIFSSASKSGFTPSQYKLLSDEYCKQEERIKLEILRCVCDDLMQSDIVRSELERRSSRGRIKVMDVEKNGGNDVKRKDPTYEIENAGLVEEIVNDVPDPNSDECWLCQMDGNLICCDGCPAAYHLKCVGLAKDLLPEGDWYCLECTLKRKDGWMKPLHPLQGAELFGIDCHGRLYFGSCGYLLVSDSCEQESSSYYYNKDDVASVVEVLKSDVSYASILHAISSYWDFSMQSSDVKDYCESIKYSICEQMDMRTMNCDVHKTDAISGVEVMEACATPDSFNVQSGQVGESIIESNLVTGTHDTQKNVSYISSEASPKTASQSEDNLLVRHEENLSECADPCVAEEFQLGHPSSGSPSLVINLVKEGMSRMQNEPNLYINYYSFGQMAASFAEELKQKSFRSNDNECLKSDEEIISAELKVISKNSTKLCWSSVRRLHGNALKENCGWCFSCRSSSDRECLFNSVNKVFVEIGEAKSVGIETENNQDTHLMLVIFHMLSIEDRLKGLLAGPWENPQHSFQWRKNVLKASHVTSLKYLLLALESKLRLVALSPEWSKQVDSSVTVGSASHVLTSSVHIPSKHGGGKKRTGRIYCQDSDSNYAFHAKSSIHWWRGGRLSRQVFNWKMLPLPLASLGARQGGCRKIPGIFYPDGSELAKRSKGIAWRAAVEMSMTLAHLAYQVRVLELNVRWNDITSTELFPKAVKDCKKLVKPLKNVIIRKKRVDGRDVHYLLDFGKRKTVPDTVTEHGILVGGTLRKKFWLSESYVPLSLLKAFEMKKLAGKLNKNSKVDTSEEAYRRKRSLRKKGLSYLFSKLEDKLAKIDKQVLSMESIKRKKILKKKRQSKQPTDGDRNESSQCGHCRKDVLVREAFKCRSCKNLFHKRHITASHGAKTKRTYACYNCQRKTRVKLNAKPRKAKQKLQTRTSMVTRSASKKKGPKPVQKGKRPVTNKEKGSSRKRKNWKIVQNDLRQSKRSLLSVENHDNKITWCKGSRPVTTEGKRSSLKRKSSEMMKKDLPQSKRILLSVENHDCEITWCKGRRAKIGHSYWLNGVHWTRKPNDQRGIHFREGKIVLSEQQSEETHLRPTCSLCNGGHHVGLIYIGCEVCSGWFHGDAFGFALEKSNYIIGFKCHHCRMRDTPTCPHSETATTECWTQKEKSIDTEGVTDMLKMEKSLSSDEAIEGIDMLDGDLKEGTSAEINQSENQLLDLAKDNELPDKLNEIRKPSTSEEVDREENADSGNMIEHEEQLDVKIRVETSVFIEAHSLALKSDERGDGIQVKDDSRSAKLLSNVGH